MSMMNPDEYVWMDPEVVLFTQLSLEAHFSSTASGTSVASAASYSAALKLAGVLSLEGTVASLLRGNCKLEDFPAIHVFEHQARFYALDNRRLYVFKKYARALNTASSAQSPTRAQPAHEVTCRIRVIVVPATEQLVKLTAGAGMHAHVSTQSSEASQHLPEEVSCAFEQLILPWAASAAAKNSRMLSGQVQPLPGTFVGGALQYSSLLLPLVAEEVRAQVDQALEAIQEHTPHAQVEIELLSTQPNQPPTASGNLKMVQISLGTGREDQRSDPVVSWEAVPVKPTDLVLISSAPLEGFRDLGKSGLIYSLAIINSFTSSEDGTQALKATLYAPDGGQLHQGLDQQAVSEERRYQWYITPLGTVATAMRVWDALQGLVHGQSGKAPGVTPLLWQVLHGPGHFSSSMCGSSQLVETSGYEGKYQTAVRAYCVGSGLNPSQAETVMQVTAAGKRSEETPTGLSHIHLIQGPPGTGKTSTIVRMLLVLAGSGCPTLLCAPTNVAVHEVARRLLQELEGGQFKQQFMATAGLPGAYSLKQLQLGDIVLLASEDKVQVDGPLDAILLPTRAKRLLQALGPQGWSHQASKLSSFLGSSLLKLFTEAQEPGDEVGEGVIETGGRVSGVQPTAKRAASYRDMVPAEFKSWFCKELECLAQSLRSIGRALTHDLPSEMLSAQSAAQVHEALALLQRLQHQAGTMPAKQLLQVCKAVAEEGLAGQSSVMADLWGQLLAVLGIPVRHAVPASAMRSEYQLQRMCLERALLVFCTVSSAGRGIMAAKQQQEASFAACIIDEAGQLVEAETAIILQGWPGLSVLALVGDHKQLPATVISTLAKERGYGRSLFERLQQLGLPLHMLDVQYRMHPKISQWPCRTFYGSKVRDGPNVKHPDYSSQLGHGPHLPELGPFAFINVPEGWEEREPGSSSISNPVEARMVAAIVKHLQQLHKHRRQGLSGGAGTDIPAGGKADAGLSIGIISPYAGQVEYVMEKLGMSSVRVRREKRAAGVLVDDACTVEVRSVDGFQGREMDIIIFSAVRNNIRDAIGFVNDPRRLNVAITRGRHAVWVIGHAALLARANEVWGKLVQDAASRGCLHEATHIPELKQVIKGCQLALKRQGIIAQPGHSLFAGCLWEVVFSAEFKNSIQDLDTKYRPKAIDMLLELAKGRRPARYPESVASSLAGPEYRHLIHVQRVVGMHMVWSVDVDEHHCRQILKVWDICSHGRVISWVRRLEAAFRVYSPGYLRRCAKIRKPESAKPTAVEAIPCDWPQGDDAFVWLATPGQARGAGEEAAEGSSSVREAAICLEESSVQDSLLLMKFFSLSSAVSSALCWSKQSSQLELLFRLNKEETRIVEFNR